MTYPGLVTIFLCLGGKRLREEIRQPDAVSIVRTNDASIILYIISVIDYSFVFAPRVPVALLIENCSRDPECFRSLCFQIKSFVHRQRYSHSCSCRHRCGGWRWCCHRHPPGSATPVEEGLGLSMQLDNYMPITRKQI